MYLPTKFQRNKESQIRDKEEHQNWQDHIRRWPLENEVHRHQTSRKHQKFPMSISVSGIRLYTVQTDRLRVIWLRSASVIRPNLQWLIKKDEKIPRVFPWSLTLLWRKFGVVRSVPSFTPVPNILRWVKGKFTLKKY